jgi:serine/threonine protein kinase
LYVTLPLTDKTLSNITNHHLLIKQKLKIIYKLASAIKYLHNNNILHLDINENIIALDDNLEPCISDLSSCRIVQNIHQSIHLPNYIPKYNMYISTNRLYNSYNDIWSFGMVMIHLLLERNVNNEILELTSDLQQFKKILLCSLPKLLENIPYEYYNDCLDILQRIFNLEININDICDHHIFIDIIDDVNDTNITNDTNFNDIIVLADNHRDTLKLLIHWCRKIYEKYDMALLFLAIDIFNRAAAKVSITNNMNTIATVALYLSSKFWTSEVTFNTILEIVNIEAPDITLDNCISTEINIIRLLDGNLYSSHLYNKCLHVEHLILSFNKIIMDRDSTLYFKVDIDQWIISMSEHIDNPSNNKNIAICDFFS